MLFRISLFVVQIRIRENKFIRCKIYNKYNDESREKKSLAVSKIDFVYFQVFFFFIFKIIQLTLISTNDHFIDFIHKRTH